MRSLPAVITVAAVLALALGGCAPEGTSEPSDSPAPAPTRTATAPPTSTPEPTETEEPAEEMTATPVTIDCNTLVSPQAVYDFNPNYGHQPAFTPAAGTDVATIVASQGVACGWVNQTSNVTFVVAVAQPAPDDLASIRAGLPASTAASGVGDAAYFAKSGDSGVAQVFAGPYWIVASSPAFYEFAAPKPLLHSAVAALGQ